MVIKLSLINRPCYFKRTRSTTKVWVPCI